MGWHRCSRRCSISPCAWSGSASSGAGLYERNPDRRGYANGYKSKTLDTTAGTVTVDVPKAAGIDEPFDPAVAGAPILACGDAAHRRDVRARRLHPRCRQGDGRIRPEEPVVDPGQPGRSSRRSNAAPARSASSPTAMPCSASPPPSSSKSTRIGQPQTASTSTGTARMPDRPNSKSPDIRLLNHFPHSGHRRGPTGCSIRTPIASIAQESAVLSPFLLANPDPCKLTIPPV